MISVEIAPVAELAQRANESAELAEDAARDVDLMQQSMDHGLLPKLDILTAELGEADLPRAIAESQ